MSEFKGFSTRQIAEAVAANSAAKVNDMHALESIAEQIASRAGTYEADGAYTRAACELILMHQKRADRLSRDCLALRHEIAELQRIRRQTQEAIKRIGDHL